MSTRSAGQAQDGGRRGASPLSRDPAEAVAAVAAAKREVLLRVHRHRLRLVIAGLRLDTSHEGTDVGPNRAQDGPRWRIFDQIPAWAHWSVRHPPGL